MIDRTNDALPRDGALRQVAFSRLVPVGFSRGFLLIILSYTFCVCVFFLHMSHPMLFIRISLQHICELFRKKYDFRLSRGEIPGGISVLNLTAVSDYNPL